MTAIISHLEFHYLQLSVGTKRERYKRNYRQKGELRALFKEFEYVCPRLSPKFYHKLQRKTGTE